MLTDLQQEMLQVVERNAMTIRDMHKKRGGSPPTLELAKEILEAVRTAKKKTSNSVYPIEPGQPATRPEK